MISTYRMVIRSKGSFKKLKDQIVIWKASGMSGEVSREDADIFLYRVLGKVLNRYAFLPKGLRPTIETVSIGGVKVKSFTFTDEMTIDLVLADLSAYPINAFGDFFDVKQNVITVAGKGKYCQFEIAVWDDAF